MLLNILLKYHGLVTEDETLGQQIFAGWLIFAGLAVFFGLGISVLSNIVKFLFSSK